MPCCVNSKIISLRLERYSYPQYKYQPLGGILYFQNEHAYYQAKRELLYTQIFACPICVCFRLSRRKGIRYDCNRYSRNKIYRKTVLIDRNIVFMKMMCYCNTLNRDIITANTDELTFTEKHSSCILVVIGFFLIFFF